MKKTISVQEKSVNYHIDGAGLPVMLIHGLAEDRTIWDGIAAALISDFLFITPDLPGSGLSQANATTSMESMSAICKAILDAEKISAAVVIGHSMGGYVSLAFAEMYPEALLALGLFHSSAYADDEEKSAGRRKMINFILSHGTQAYLKQATPNLFSEFTRDENPQLVEGLIQRYSDFNPASIVAYHEAMIARPDRTHILESIVKPVLFIMGRYDKTIPYDVSLKQSHLPALAYIHVLSKSGHMGMLEEEARCIEILHQSLSDLNE